MKKAALLILIFVLMGCEAASIESSSGFVVRAEAVDWIWGVEELGSGAARIWLRNDDIAGYCTADPTLAAQAKDMAGELVKITFEQVRWNSTENGYSTGCSRLSTGYEQSTPIFKLTGIERLED